MTPLITLITDPNGQRLAWTLLHFLWQGAVVGVLAVAAMRWVASTASGRYLTGILALAIMLAFPVATFYALSPSDPVVGLGLISGAITLQEAGTAGADLTLTLWPAPQSILPFLVVVVWLLGVTALSIRLAGGWIVARRLISHGVEPVSAEVQRLAEHVAERLELRRLARIVESSAVSVPVMIGWLKPVVLLPAAALSGLTPAQLEGLIAHELAHVRRHDYLVNLLQTVVETLLFYHPAVWWISREVRAEREHCCDDLAVEVCDRLVYVSALTELAAMKSPHLALAATDGSLVRRVRRILDTGESSRPAGGSVGLVVMVLMVLGAGVPMAISSTAASNPASGTDLIARVESSVPLTSILPFPAPVTPQPMPVTLTDQGGAVAPTMEPATEAARRQAAEAEQRLLALQVRARETESQLEELKKALITLERGKAEKESQGRIAELKRRLDVLKAAYADTKTKYDIGLVSPGDLGQVEASVASLELELVMAEADAQFRTETAKLESLLAPVMREHERLAEERAKAMQDAERAYTEMTAREMQVAEARMRAGMSGMEPLARTARIAVGDSLSIIVHGEGAFLPYPLVVAEDGTIRMPLLGHIRVRDLTSAQVEGAIGKQLADHRLATDKKVEVSVRRPSK